MEETGNQQPTDLVKPNPLVEPGVYSTQGDITKEGDLVIIFESADHVVPIVLTPGSTYNTHRGLFSHESLIGKPYGSKVYSRDSKGFVFLFKLDPSLWARAVPARTQILFTPDISAILSRCDMFPGMNVIESGTGSGVLTHYISQLISPGMLYSFDICEERVKSASEEMKEHGCDNVVVSTRNVYEDGFFSSEETGIYIDAVILDLPEPWFAIRHLDGIMKSGAVLCVFSPCVEQILKTIEELKGSKFSRDVEVIECSNRGYDVPRSGYSEPRLVRQRAGKANSIVRIENDDYFPTMRCQKIIRTHTGYLLFTRYIGEY